MTPQKGYYSLIQFCPDASRLESINIGVILFCPEIGFLDAKTSSNTRRAEKLVGRGELAREALQQARYAIEQRLKVSRDSFKDIEALNKFVATRGNSLLVTIPRPIKVVEPARELLRLFDELVGGSTSRAKKDKSLFPELEKLFNKLNEEGRAELDYHSRLPVLEQEFSVPFAYRNGDFNLVKPQSFNTRASQKALDLAIRGDLIKKHGLDGEQNTQLVVVSRFDTNCDSSLISHVDELLCDYGVKHVREGDIDGFVKRIESEAHV